MSMTLTEARSVITGGVLKLPSNASNNTRIDQAIIGAGSEFMRKVRPVSDTFDVTLTAEDSAFTVAESGFLPRYTMDVQTVVDGGADPDRYYSVQQVTVDNIRRMERRGSLAALHPDLVPVAGENGGVPRYVAFTSDTSGILYPTPDEAHTLRIRWWQPFTSFTAGTADPGSVTLNIPDDMIYGVLWYGVPAYYERGNEQARFVNEARQRFDQHIRECMGLHNTSATRVVLADDAAYQ